LARSEYVKPKNGKTGSLFNISTKESIKKQNWLKGFCRYMPGTKSEIAGHFDFFN
jgi:hypothetical protein